MLIRCEKCKALFSLQDGVVRGPQGEVPPAFAVECGRCHTLFQAEAPATLRPTSQRKTPSPPVAPVQKMSKPKPSAASERPLAGVPTNANLARALKPNRPAEIPDDELFAKELARIARRRRIMLWSAGVIALAIIVVVVAPIIRKRFTNTPAAARAKLELAHKKLLLDDAQSLQAAADLDQAAARLAPGDTNPEGERAFALLLSAGAHKDLADRAEAKATALNDEVAKLQIGKPDGFEKQVDSIRTRLIQLNEEREPHARAAVQQLKEGLAVAKAALEEDPDEPAALRAMALYSALNNAVSTGVSYADKADNLVPNDPFTEYVRAQLWLCGSPSREKQDKGQQQLALVQQTNPHLLRALYDSAAIDVDRQQNNSAREKLDKLLAENPAHERALHLRASLPATP